MSIIRIGQAGIDEWDGTHGGQAGNQTRTGITPEKPEGNLDGELNVREWYNKPWEYCFRCKDADKAEKIAQTMYDCVANANIGYDQNERTTLYNQLVANNWDISKIAPCECDCSSLVAVCVNAAGIRVTKDMYTGSEYKNLMETGLFDCFTDEAHCSSIIGLQRGDILLKTGEHTLIVLDTYQAEPEYKDKYISTANVYMRSGPGKEYPTVGVIPPSTTVMVAEIVDNWAHCIYSNITGWTSLTYLQKVEPEPGPTPTPITLITTDRIYLREDAGTQYRALTDIPVNTILNSDGTTKMVDETPWYKLSYNGYTGFSSGKYLRVIQQLDEDINTRYYIIYG